MKFIEFSVKNLLRSKTRTVLTIVSISVTAFVLFIVIALDNGFKSAVKEQLVKGVGAHLIIARGGCPMDAASIIAQGGISPMYVPEELEEEIKLIKGIRGIMPFKTFAITSFDGMRTDIFTGVRKEVEMLKTHWQYDKGGWFEDEQSIILGADIARIEQRDVGDMLYFEHFDREFRVCGILSYAYNQDDGIFFLPLATAQELIRRKGKVSAIAISVSNLNTVPRIQASLKAKLSDDFMVLRPEAIGEEIMKFYNSTRVIMFAVLVFTLIVATVGLTNTMIIMIFERRKELAYLRCVGAGFGDIYKLIFQETVMICGAGILLGLSGGFLLANVFEGLAHRYLLSDFISKTSNIVAPDLFSALIVCLIVFITAIIAVSYPALKAARITPMEAITNE